MSSLPEIIDHTGVKRKLGYKPPGPEHRKVRASIPNISTVTPLIQQKDWTEIDLTISHPKDLLANQLQEGACVGGSCAGAFSRMLFVRTGRLLMVSLWYIYDQINGGQDNGAVITDAMGVMMGKGAPPLSAYPKSLWVPNRDPAVPFYKEDQTVTITGVLDFATAILKGWYPQGPILVDNTFENFTSEGVAMGGRAPRGNQSDHSIYLAGLKKLPIAGWVWKMVNSWGEWGPFGDGTCYLPLDAIANPAQPDDGWCHISVVDPTENVQPAV